jgi:hypothetical protein
MELPETQIETRFRTLERRLREDPELAPDFLESRREFFAARFDHAVIDRDDAARRRHLEWYLFERVHPSWERLGIEHVAERLGAESGFDDELEQHALLHSFAGVFEVASLGDDGVLWLSDLSSQGEFPVVAPTGAHTITPGDLIAGRLFPAIDGTYALSPAAAHHRNPDLIRALRVDMERARAARRGIVRISQRELERMFFAAGASGAPEDPVGEARQFLLSSGVEREEVEGWFEELAETPFLPETLRIGVDDALGPILDRLAFDSELDLEAARRALLFAWETLAASGPGTGASLTPTSPPPSAPPRRSRDVAEVVAAFDQKRKNGAPLDVVFAELEAELDVADESAGEDEVDAAPDFPGVVAAMITEFLWETEQESGAARALALRPIESFGRFAHHIGVFENLSARDLLGYAAWWLPESGELENADDARSTLAALGSFCQWADETQELSLRPIYDAMAGGLRTTLPRIIEANRRRTRSADPSSGELYEVVGVERGALRLRDRKKVEHEAIVDVDLTEWLVPGDRLRAHRHEDRRLAVYCCYPPESRGLEADQRVG